MQPQTQLDFADMMFDALMAYNTDPAKTGDACINDVRNLVDMIWERAQDSMHESSYNDTYQEGYEAGKAKGFSQGYEDAKKNYESKPESK